MGLSLARDCPYCKTRHVAQTAVHAWQTKTGDKRALFKCGHCGEAIIRDWYIPGSNRIDIMQYSGDAESMGLLTTLQWPSLPLIDAPEDSPPTVANYFKQAADSLNAGNYDASGTMFRKCLESATKILDPALAKLTLSGRVKDLVARHVITPALGDWADEIRLGGNEAAHDDEPYSSEDAQSLRDFCEKFLIYAFTLPSAVGRRADK